MAFQRQFLPDKQVFFFFLFLLFFFLGFGFVGFFFLFCFFLFIMQQEMCGMASKVVLKGITIRVWERPDECSEE